METVFPRTKLSVVRLSFTACRAGPDPDMRSIADELPTIAEKSAESAATVVMSA